MEQVTVKHRICMNEKATEVLGELRELGIAYELEHIHGDWYYFVWKENLKIEDRRCGECVFKIKDECFSFYSFRYLKKVRETQHGCSRFVEGR